MNLLSKDWSIARVWYPWQFNKFNIIWWWYVTKDNYLNDTLFCIIMNLWSYIYYLKGVIHWTNKSYCGNLNSIHLEHISKVPSYSLSILDIIILVFMSYYYFSSYLVRWGRHLWDDIIEVIKVWRHKIHRHYKSKTQKILIKKFTNTKIHRINKS